MQIILKEIKRKRSRSSQTNQQSEITPHEAKCTINSGEQTSYHITQRINQKIIIGSPQICMSDIIFDICLDYLIYIFLTTFLMVQRVTYRRRLSYNTTSNKVRKVRTPGNITP